MDWLRRLFRRKRPHLVDPTPEQLDQWVQSQHGEDRFIYEVLSRASAPFVVDVGANDGHAWSNSYLFGKLGYELLLIEPMPKYAAFCRERYAGSPAVRVEEVAISAKRGSVDFFVNLDSDNDLLAMRSSLDQGLVPGDQTTKISVRTEPLSDVLARAGCPARYALLSIDAEGRDLEVLQTADLRRFRPEIICVEDECLGFDAALYLAGQGYHGLNRLGSNGIYKYTGTIERPADMVPVSLASTKPTVA